MLGCWLGCRGRLPAHLLFWGGDWVGCSGGWRGCFLHASKPKTKPPTPNPNPNNNAQQTNTHPHTVRLIKTARKRNPSLQLLLFSATFNDKIKSFALRIAPRANQVFVPKESLSLDVIKQYNVACPSPADKARVLQEQIFPNCEKLGQTIIFTRTRAEAARLHQLMAGLGYKCTSLRVRGQKGGGEGEGAPLPLKGREGCSVRRPAAAPARVPCAPELRQNAKRTGPKQSKPAQTRTTRHNQHNISNTTQHNTTQHNTTQHNTTQPNRNRATWRPPTATPS